MDNLVYFIASLKELPKEALENNIFKFQDTKYVFSFLGVTQEDYNKYIVGSPHEVLPERMVRNGCNWWGEIRASKKSYPAGATDKQLISITEENAADTVALMKVFARKIVEREIAAGHSGYNQTVINMFESASSIKELNVLYEDFIGVPMPDGQALEMNRFNSNGQRIYNENRLTISNFQRKILPIQSV